MNKIKSQALYILIMLLLFMASGCMVGPKYVRPENAADTNDGFFNAGDNSQDVNDLPDVYRWWERFGDEVTSELVIEALEKNNDLKAAVARVIQARSVLDEAIGRQVPNVFFDAGFDRSKRRISFGGSSIPTYNTTYTYDFSVSYVLDLFGKLRHSEQAAWASVLASKASEHAVINSLIATVVKLRIDIATLQRGLEIAKANTSSRQDTLNIVERRYAEGLVSPVDVRLARENLASSQAQEPFLERQIALSLHALDVLLARRPGTTPTLPKTLPDLPELEPVPIGLPASLLDRRPDVRAAEFTLEAANEEIGVNIANLFPDLTLTGIYGRNADRFRDIWMPETEIYSAIFSLAQPVFRGGQLQARIRGSKARFEELAAGYSTVVLNALKEVEDALVAEEKLLEQLEYVKFQVQESMAAENLSRDRYQRGVDSILTVLESERRRRLAENEEALLKGSIWNTRVDLFLSLGGDWIDGEQKEQQGGN